MDPMEALAEFPLDFQVYKGNIFPPGVGYVSDSRLFFILSAIADLDCRLSLEEKPNSFGLLRHHSWPQALRLLWNFLPINYNPLIFQRFGRYSLYYGNTTIPKSKVLLVIPNTKDFVWADTGRLKLALELLRPDFVALGGYRDFKVLWFFKNEKPVGCLSAMTDD